MENLGVWSDGVGENSEVFISEFSVLSVVKNPSGVLTKFILNSWGLWYWFTLL